MPIFVFECKNEECEHVYEELTSYDEKGIFEGVKCPVCGSEDKDRQVHTVGFNFTNPQGQKDGIILMIIDSVTSFLVL